MNPITGETVTFINIVPRFIEPARYIRYGAQKIDAESGIEIRSRIAAGPDNLEVILGAR